MVSTVRSTSLSLWWWALPSLQWLVSSWWPAGSSSSWQERSESSTMERTQRTHSGGSNLSTLGAKLVSKCTNAIKNVIATLFRRHESVPTLERATKFNPMFESDPVTAQYYRRYGDSLPQYHQCCDSTLPQHCSKDPNSEEIQNICQNTTLTKEVISLSMDLG